MPKKKEMTPEEIEAKVEELELVSMYGSPAEAAQAARELAKLKASDMYKQYKAEMGMDVDDAYQNPVAQAGGNGDVTRAKVQLYGRTHTSLNVFDALRTMGYTEAEIKTYCKENKVKYQAPPSSSGRMRVN